MRFDNRPLLSTELYLLAPITPGTENTAEDQDWLFLPGRKDFFNIAGKQNIHISDQQGNKTKFLPIKFQRKLLTHNIKHADKVWAEINTIFFFSTARI